MSTLSIYKIFQRRIWQVLKLDLSRNSLSGEVPPEIGNCNHLTYLEMSQNKLSSSITPEISNVRILDYLNLSRNHLNQNVPKSIECMNSLTTADFSFNDFVGKLLEWGQFTVLNASSFAGNPQICGTLLNNLQLDTNRSPARKSPPGISSWFLH